MTFRKIDDGIPAIQKGICSGLNTKMMREQGRDAELLSKPIMYMAANDDGSGYGSLDSGLAYSLMSLPALDTNKSGAVETNEVGPLGQYLDIDQNGKNKGVITPAEDLAFSMWGDTNQNGISEPEERVASYGKFMEDPEKYGQEVKQIYDDNDLANKNGEMGLPSEAAQTADPAKDQARFPQQACPPQGPQGPEGPPPAGQAQPVSQANPASQCGKGEPQNIVQYLEQMLQNLDEAIANLEQKCQSGADPSQDQAKFPQQDGSSSSKILENLKKLRDVIQQLYNMVRANQEQGAEDGEQEACQPNRPEGPPPPPPTSICNSEINSGNDNGGDQYGGIQNREITNNIQIIVASAEEALDLANKMAA